MEITSLLVACIILGLFLLLLALKIFGGDFGASARQRLPFTVLAVIAGVGVLSVPFLPQLLGLEQTVAAPEVGVLRASLRTARSETSDLSSRIATLEADKARHAFDMRASEEANSSHLVTILAAVYERKRTLSGAAALADRTDAVAIEVAKAMTNREKRDMIVREIAGLRDHAGSVVDGGALEVCRADTRSLGSRLTAIEADKSRLVEQNDQIQDNHGAHLFSILSTVHDTRQLLTRKLGESASWSMNVTESVRNQSTGQKYQHVVTELDSLRRTIAGATLQCERRPEELSSDLLRLRDRMGAQMKTESYDVSTYPDNELIRGKRGRYYVVDIKDAAQGVRFHFDAGKYTIATRQEQFRSSLNKFVQDILEKVHGKVDYQIFVRGSADSAQFRGRFEPGHEYRNVRYLRTLGGDKYGNELGTLRIDGNSIQNTDLPNLRAAFLQRVVGSVYALSEPVILDGSVTSKVAQADRNAELIVFLNW